MTSDQYVSDVILVEELPSNSWVEGMALRPNGEALLTLLDQPEVHVVNPSTPGAPPRLVHTFSEGNSVINICPLSADKDEYAVLTGNVDVEKVQFADFTIWRMKITSEDASSVEVEKVTHLPDALLAIGLTPVTERILLVGDSAKNCISRLDMATGNLTLLVESDWMKTLSDEDFFGLNRMRIAGNYLWFTNNSAGSLCRIPIELSEDPEVAVRTVGDVQLVCADIPHCDGLVISEDCKAAYMVNYVGGTLWRVDIDPSGRGSTSSIMENLVSPTAVETRKDADGKRNLYVVCCGELDIGWITEDDRRSWGDIAQINASVEVSVTVTEEVV